MLSDLADYQFISTDNRISITESNPDPFHSYSDPIFKQEISQIRWIGMEYSIIGLIRWAHSALNIQCRSGQVRLIGIEYSVIILIRWAHSALNIQCSSGHVRLIRIEYLMVGLIKWAHSDSIFNAAPDRLG